MNENVIRTIAVVGSALLAGVSVNLIFWVVGSDDMVLATTFIAFTAAGLSLDIHKRLSRKYAPSEMSVLDKQ